MQMGRLFTILGAVLLVTGCAASGVPSALTPAATSRSTPPAAIDSPAVNPGDSSSAPATVAPTSPPNSTATASDDAEPAGDSWIEAGTLHEGRSVTQLAILSETNEVMAVGADIACGLESEASDTTELYEMDAGTWKPGPRMPTGRHTPAVAALGDRVLVTGGSNQEYVAKSGTVLYDPNARTWSPSGLLNTARIDPAISVMSGGRVLVAGGLLINLDQTGRAIDTAEIWDPGAGTWSQTAKLSGPRYGPKAVTLDDGRVLVVGGLPAWGADDQRRSAELYDPSAGRWKAAGELAKTPMMLATFGPTWISLVATSGGALAVYAPADGQALRAEWFDPDKMAWSPAGDPDMSIGEGRAVAVTLRDGRVLVIGGDEARIFEPGGTWTPARSIPDGPRNDASAVLLPDGSVLVAGGWSIGTPPGDTGGCETPNPQAWRYIPAPEGSG
jgi:hypothetical protein